ncbi:hypothetical protein BLA29_011823 [Euroglyphus maynei]|uniref:Uncharacterized protein n=1 Tax=Euroglyphus maynei TaxID=6958 RepID=A0A1Y3B6M2_EURMA|nr:hypothetical protein BLA29_011823 [Euroglyphus maynei]
MVKQEYYVRHRIGLNRQYSVIISGYRHQHRAVIFAMLARINAPKLDQDFVAQLVK